MSEDVWNPRQYEKYKDQRAKPFYDLLALVQPSRMNRIVDLGCGTGELTMDLHRKLGPKETIGLDSSPKMLERALELNAEGLRFERDDISSWNPEGRFDLVVSNAALQWVDGHEELFPRLLDRVASGGQVAIQMPANFDHPSHRVAEEVGGHLRRHPVMGVERYAEILYACGFQNQRCLVEVYGHPMSSGREVIEWTKGTLLTAYQKQMSKSEFAIFIDRYSERLLSEIGTGPYFYAFKRMLLWGRKND